MCLFFSANYLKFLLKNSFIFISKIINIKMSKSTNSLLLGRIIGYNTDSGLLYKTQMGLAQFAPKQNVVPPPVNYSTYRNEANVKVTLEELNSKPGSPPNKYRGKRDRLVVSPDVQPPPLTLTGGKTQDSQ
jgi:hypothetical protein